MDPLCSCGESDICSTVDDDFRFAFPNHRNRLARQFEKLLIGKILLPYLDKIDAIGDSTLDVLNQRSSCQLFAIGDIEEDRPSSRKIAS